MQVRSTTIIVILHNGKAAMAGDGQVTFDETVMKTKASKIRTLYDGQILVGFAGAVADALTLYELLEKKTDEYSGNLPKAVVELAKDWRTDRALQKLEAIIAVTDKKHVFLVSGTGEVIEPDDGIVAIGSGGTYALAAARAIMWASPKLSAEKVARKALEIAADICIYTNNNINVETLK
ncbi:MAG: ATP-dependent protease subunit HslV [candidate division Zixibacteria bacterium]|nr:ATP-dependent protease subunit HslV [candidate division Zixibacteria bacterium]